MVDKRKLKELADNAVEGFFEVGIDDSVNSMVNKIVDAEHIDKDDDIAYLRMLIERGILKWN